jgi:hypothetical protein
MRTWENVNFSLMVKQFQKEKEKVANFHKARKSSRPRAVEGWEQCFLQLCGMPNRRNVNSLWLLIPDLLPGSQPQTNPGKCAQCGGTQNSIMATCMPNDLFLLPYSLIHPAQLTILSPGSQIMVQEAHGV